MARQSLDRLPLLERIIPTSNFISLRPLRLCGKTSTVVNAHGATRLDLCADSAPELTSASLGLN
jgi:hypothetical protein